MTTAAKKDTAKKNELSAAQKKTLDGFDKTSTKIRYLASLNFTNSQIKDMLKIRYQHVRNVLLTPVKNPVEKF